MFRIARIMLQFTHQHSMEMNEYIYYENMYVNN